MRIHGLRVIAIFTFGLLLAGAHTLCTPSGDTIPRDCKEVYNRGCTQDGVYTIDPGCPGIKPFQVRCDMKNGNWTVFQRRMHAVQSFNKNWQEYEEGFGDPRFEYWLGLKNLHCLTFGSCVTELRVDMADYRGVKKYAIYSSIAVHNAENKYKLSLGEYKNSSNAGDSLKSSDNCIAGGIHDGMYFSTHDRDNDRASGNCALGRGSGWWYNNCECSDLNRPYNIYISNWHTFSSSLKCTEMKVRSKE